MPAAARLASLILNADDFGRSPSINVAVIEAHRRGALTSASLMVTGEAAAEAVTLVRQTPTLGVGLHLVLGGGRPALPPTEIPRLVDADGLLPGGPASAGARYVLSHATRAELAREIRAQFDLFAATGLPLDHVNGHMHLHLLPGVFEIVAPLAAERGAGGIRLARDDLSLALRHDRRWAAANVLWAAAFGVFDRRAESRLALLERKGGHRPVTATRVYGLMQTGRMTEAYVLAALRSLAALTCRGDRARTGARVLAEFYFHPDTAPRAEPLGPNPGDLATLRSAAVIQAIKEGGFDLTTYRRAAESRTAASDPEVSAGPLA